MIHVKVKSLSQSLSNMMDFLSKKGFNFKWKNKLFLDYKSSEESICQIILTLYPLVHFKRNRSIIKIQKPFVMQIYIHKFINYLFPS